MAHKLLSFALVGALVGAFASAMAACGSSVPIRARGASGGVQGSAWELVVPGPEVALALAEMPPGDHPAYLTRRDHALGGTTPSWAPVAISGEAPATIGRQQSVYLRRSYDSFLFFTSPGAWAPERSWPAPSHGWGHQPPHPSHGRHWIP